MKNLFKQLALLISFVLLTNLAISAGFDVTLTPSDYNGKNVSCFGPP
jgi:hypothetical protein